ncbi:MULTISPECIES: GNAT family N-acetyltransferase [unclassified Frankia]|uniref:GNAT family N-acetyltransferase n=1 Tax=unclassified Frankia TaxID=2632575 RepID=UPI000A912209|nr:MULTISPECIES: GNAT family N-acetyltransferase [unclassified Frankia]
MRLVVLRGMARRSGRSNIAGVNNDAVVISRVVEDRHWHALENDLVVGRGEALRRPDGRLFLGVDAWQDRVFQPLVATMLTELPEIVYTLVDDEDVEARARWRDAGFVTYRQERVYAVATDPQITRLDQIRAPSGIEILPLGQAAEAPLSELDRVVRAEVDAAAGWQSMPVELRTRPDGTVGVIDPADYVVAAQDGEYLGLARVARVPRRSRLGLVAVRTARRRQGLARAMLAELLGSLHRAGVDSVTAEVDDYNKPANALLLGIGAQQVGSASELLHR